MAEKNSWHALESDPDLWRVYLDKLGVEMNSLELIEIYALDEDFPPEPSIFAFVFLYPDSGASRQSTPVHSQVNDQLWTIKQIDALDNCCCLIALLHAIGNNLDKVTLKSQSPLAEFFEKTKVMTSDERALVLLNDERIHQAHEETAEQGQTDMLESNRVGHHYISYILSNTGGVYEMNGGTRTPQAKLIGQSSEENFFATVIREIQRRANELNGDIHFNLVAIAKK